MRNKLLMLVFVLTVAIMGALAPEGSASVYCEQLCCDPALTCCMKCWRQWNGCVCDGICVCV